MLDVVAAKAAHLHPGREPSSRPPPADQIARAVTNWRTIGGFVIIAFLAGWGACSALLLWQLTSVKEQNRLTYERVSRIDDKLDLGFKSEALSRSLLAERVAKLEGEKQVTKP